MSVKVLWLLNTASYENALSLHLADVNVLLFKAASRLLILLLLLPVIGY